MNEEKTMVSTSVEMPDTGNENGDYIKAINDLKQNTVPKDQYAKLKEENKKLLDTLVTGGQIEPEREVVDIDELRRNLFTKEHTNLEYVEEALKLRSALIEKGECDPFLPSGRKIAPQDDDILKANKTAQILQECVDYADGNSSIFTNELQRRLVDNIPTRSGWNSQRR